MVQTLYTTPVLIVGGSLGAVAAALSCGRMGVPAIVAAPDHWIGGQATSQGVPPDEHPWIDTTGCTASYREYRTRIRQWYRTHLPLDSRWALEPALNPGGGHVSPITHDPRVSHQVLREMLLPFQISGVVTVLTGLRPRAVEMAGDRVRAVDFRAVASREAGSPPVHITADYVVDATETGELLPLSGTEYRVGAESQREFDEPHAPEAANPGNQQAVSWCAILGRDVAGRSRADRSPGARSPVARPPVARPPSYHHWKTTVAPFWRGPQLSFTTISPFTLEEQHTSLDRLWLYRRIHRPELYSPDHAAVDTTALNWPQIDYWEKPLVDDQIRDNRAADPADAAGDDPARDLGDQQNVLAAKELTLSFIHWLQTEAPRHDGGTGYPEVFLRTDIFDTPDGLAREVYVRESRRIVALTTVTERDIAATREGGEATQYRDTVGLASYRIDLHPTTGGDSYIDIESYPAQIPLGALVPVRVENLIPGCKNIGTTHLSSGMYRVHPAEWNIGEAAGALAAWCVTRQKTPRGIAATPGDTAEFQEVLHGRLGFELQWPSYIRRISRYQPQLQWVVREKRQGWQTD